MLRLTSRFSKAFFYTMLTLLFIASLPLLFGWFVKKELKNIVENLELPGGAVIAMENYHLGWMRSNAVLKISYPVSQPHVMQYVSDDKIVFTLHTKILHGPILPGGFTVSYGLANLLFSTQLEDIDGLTQNFQTELTNLINDKELISASAHIGFTGDLEFIFNTTEFNQKKDTEQFVWNGLGGNFFIEGNTEHATADITVAPILFTSKNGDAINSSELKFNVDVKRKSDSPWTGTQNLTLSQFYAKDFMNNILKFSNLNFAAKSALSHNFVNASFSVTADNISMAKQDIEHLNITAKINKLAAKPLFQFETLLHSSQPLENEQTITLVNAALDAISSGAHGKVQYEIDTTQGKMTANFTIQFPDLTNKTPASTATKPSVGLEALLAGLQAELSFTAPKALLKNVLIQKALVQASIKNATTTPATTNAHEFNEFQLENSVNLQLLQLEKNNYLNLTNGNYQLDFIYKQGTITLNGRLLSNNEAAIFLLLLMQPQLL